MSTRLARAMLVIGVTASILGCATSKEWQDDQFSHIWMARLDPAAEVQDTRWAGAITVMPDQVFEN